MSILRYDSNFAEKIPLSYLILCRTQYRLQADVQYTQEHSVTDSGTQVPE